MTRFERNTEKVSPTPPDCSVMAKADVSSLDKASHSSWAF